MRKSQYLTWNVPLLQSFLKDLKKAKEKGWNLISEKYQLSKYHYKYKELENEE